MFNETMNIHVEPGIEAARIELGTRPDHAEAKDFLSAMDGWL